MPTPSTPAGGPETTPPFEVIDVFQGEPVQGGQVAREVILDHNDAIDFMRTQYQTILKTLDLPELPPGIQNQITKYMAAVAHVDRERHLEERVRELAMLDFKIAQFIFSRDRRADDIRSPEVRETIARKKRLFPLGIPKLSLCVDGRVLAKLFASLHGNSLRTPAGDSPEFVPEATGDGLFLREGKFSAMIDEVLEEQDVICEAFDSHVACAARGEAAKKMAGRELPDKGLRQDVLRKKKMAAALQRYIQKKYGDRKRVVCLQPSFDPHNGYLYMGLREDQCLHASRAIEKGYTKDVLEALVSEGKVLYTGELVNQLRELFLHNYFAINYETDYRQSTFQFWQNLEAMLPEATPIIEQKLKAVFSHLNSPENGDELKQRVLLVLANAYTAFLHNHDEKGDPKKYPYGEHDESVIVVTFSEKGPYDRARAFSVDPSDPNLSGRIDFMMGLVQGNRQAGRMSSTEKIALQRLYPDDSEDYVDNPAAVMFFERVKTWPGDVMLNKLQTTDWSDLAQTDWMNMSDQEFVEGYLDKKIPGIPAVIAEKINNLRLRAKELYTPGLPATDALLQGALVPVWTLSGPDRKTIALFPFIARGYHPKTFERAV